VILSTHILPEVQAVCNRIHILHQGRVVYDDANTEKGDTAQLTVQFGKDVDVTPILALADVHNIDHQETGRYLIQYRTGSNPANTIAAMAVEKQWGLQELTPNSMGLEHIFVSLTQGEERDNDTEKAAEAAA